MKCPQCKLETQYAEKCSCGYAFTEKELLQAERAAAKRDSFSTFRVLGLLFLIIGLASASYFLFLFDTSIAIAASGVPSRIQNVGLLQDRQIGVIGGLLLSILGSLLMLNGKE